MNKLIALMCMFMLLCGNVDAKKKKFYPAIIAKQDGTQIECLAQYPDQVNSKEIKYKANKDSKSQKMKGEEIKAIRYFIKEDNGLIWSGTQQFPRQTCTGANKNTTSQYG